MSNENKQEYLRSTGTCHGCYEIHFKERKPTFECKNPGYDLINVEEYYATHFDYRCNALLLNGERCTNIIRHCPSNGQIIAEEVRCGYHKNVEQEEKFKIQMQEWCNHPKKILTASDTCMKYITKCAVCGKKFGH